MIHLKRNSHNTNFQQGHKNCTLWGIPVHVEKTETSMYYVDCRHIKSFTVRMGVIKGCENLDLTRKILKMVVKKKIVTYIFFKWNWKSSFNGTQPIKIQHPFLRIYKWLYNFVINWWIFVAITILLWNLVIFVDKMHYYRSITTNWRRWSGSYYILSSYFLLFKFFNSGEKKI